MKKYTMLSFALMLVAAIALSGCAVETQQDAAGTPSAQGTQAAASTAYDPNGEKSLRNFTATDLEGNTVTQDIFKEHQMTMVNVWATYCPTCMEELADLAKLYAENADRNINIVGIVYDAKKSDGSIDEKQVALAKEIVEQTGATYTQLLPSPDLQEAVLGDVTTVPHTFFVDHIGMMIDEPLEGTKDMDNWQEIMDKTYRVYYGGCHVKE